MEEFSDDWLVQQAKQGNVDAFEDLTRRYQEKLKPYLDRGVL